MVVDIRDCRNIYCYRNYEKEDEEKIAQDNLSRILVDVEPEKKEDKDKEDNAENK